MADNNQIGVVPGSTGNYKLSFEIQPSGTVDDFGSILHFTTGDDCCDPGTRSPGFWFFPSSTTIGCSIGDSNDGNWYVNTDVDIPLNVRTKVTLECNGPNVKLTVGDKVYSATQPTYRYSGDLTVYAGDPFWPVANAQLFNLEYLILPAGVKSGKGLFIYN